MATSGSSERVKWPESETDLSPQSNVEVKNVWNYKSTTPLRLRDMVLN